MKVWMCLWRGKKRRGEKYLGGEKVRQKGCEGLSHGIEYKREKEEGEVEECEVLMRSRGRQPLINFVWSPIRARNMSIETGIILALQPVPEGWTESQTVHTSALTFLFKGFINSSIVLQGAPLPLPVLKALIHRSCLHCSAWASIWAKFGGSSFYCSFLLYVIWAVLPITVYGTRAGACPLVGRRFSRTYCCTRYHGSAVSMKGSEPCYLSFKTEIVCEGKY